MIFAAGLGTRLKPLTDTMPKALVRVGDKPLLYHVIMRLKAAGVERFVVNVHHFAEQIASYLEANGNFGLDIRLSDERGCLLDTGGGIKKAAAMFDADSPILIHNVDILSNVPLEALALDGESDALLVVSERNTKRYLLFDDTMRLRGWTNIETGEIRSSSRAPLSKEDADSLRKLAFSGIHLLSPRLLPLMDTWGDRFPIMDFYLEICADKRLTGYEAKGLRLMDVGKLDTLEQAEQFLNTL